MFRRRSLLIAALCAAVGAAAGIAGTAAAPKSRATHAPRAAHFRDFHGGPGRPFGGPPVHVEAVVLNKAGDKFITATSDNGKVKSVSGNDLTITEGTKTVTYKDVTLTIPSDAKIRRNFDDAQLSDLKEGDFVHVDSSADGTFVFAVDPNAVPPRPHDGPWGGGPPGPPGGPERGTRRGW